MLTAALPPEFPPAYPPRFDHGQLPCRPAVERSSAVPRAGGWVDASAPREPKWKRTQLAEPRLRAFWSLSRRQWRLGAYCACHCDCCGPGLTPPSDVAAPVCASLVSTRRIAGGTATAASAAAAAAGAALMAWRRRGGRLGARVVVVTMVGLRRARDEGAGGSPAVATSAAVPPQAPASDPAGRVPRGTSVRIPSVRGTRWESSTLSPSLFVPTPFRARQSGRLKEFPTVTSCFSAAAATAATTAPRPR